MSAFTQTLFPPVRDDHGDGDGGLEAGSAEHSSMTLGFTGKTPDERRQANIAEGDEAGQEPPTEQAPERQQTSEAGQIDASSLQLRTAKLSALDVCPAVVRLTWPVTAEAGTLVSTRDVVQSPAVTIAGTRVAPDPAKFTVPSPPKRSPISATSVSAGPAAG